MANDTAAVVGRAAIGVVLAVIVWAAWQEVRPEPGPSAEDRARTQAVIDELSTVTVRFSVTGTARTADVTFGIAGSTSQVSGADVPLKREGASTQGMEVEARRGDSLYLSAQQGDDTGRTITCRIEVDGELVDQVTSRGSFTIAACSGTA